MTQHPLKQITFLSHSSLQIQTRTRSLAIMTIPDLGAPANATKNYLLSVKSTYIKQFELLLLKGLAKIGITTVKLGIYGLRNDRPI